jgi:hypothetical protein
MQPYFLPLTSLQFSCRRQIGLSYGGQHECDHATAPLSYRRTLFPFSLIPAIFRGVRKVANILSCKVMMNLYSPYVRTYVVTTLNVKLFYSDYLSGWFSRDSIFKFLAKNRFPNSGFPQFINDNGVMSL